VSGKITALKVQQKNRDRVSVYLDGRYAFGLPAVIAAGLSLGRFLSDSDIDLLRDQGSFEDSYNRTLDYLSYRPRSEAEVTEYLRRREVPDDTITAIIQRLRGAGLLDDEAFARFWVENRERFRPRGIRALRYELRRKGITSDAIDQALDDLDTSASAYQAAVKKAHQLSGLERSVFQRKLVEYLARRGFDYDEARQAADRHWSELAAGDE
jgi:regulatory protein